jgi:hypothetical protein
MNDIDVHVEGTEQILARSSTLWAYHKSLYVRSYISGQNSGKKVEIIYSR